MKKSLWSLSSLVFILAGLGCQTPAPAPTRVDASLVIDKIKENLNAFYAVPPNTVANGGPCTNGAPFVFEVTGIKLTLKLIAGIENDPTVGLASPLGVLKINPTYSGSYSSTNTDSIVIPMGIKDPLLPAVKGTAVAPSKDTYPIANAMWNLREQLLKVDHTKTPCLTVTPDNQLTMSIAFDVVDKTTGGFGLQIPFFTVGNKTTADIESHQTLDITFSLGSTMTIMDIKPNLPDLLK
jgi:hypothetical protein